MLTTAFFIALASKAKPILQALASAYDWIKENPKTTRLVFEIALIAVIVVLILTHKGCGIHNPLRTEVVTKDTTIYIPADTSKWSKMIGDTAAYYTHVIDSMKYTSAPEPEIPENEDSCNYLLDFYKRQLRLCDTDLTNSSVFRVFKSTVETDSFRLKYDIGVYGKMAYAPIFDVQHIFPSEKQILERTTHIYEPRLSRAIWVDASAGPVMSYTDPVKFLTVRGSFSAGYSDRKGYGYGARVTADQFGWSVEGVLRRSFKLEK